MKLLTIFILLLPLLVYGQSEAETDSFNMANTFGVVFSFNSLRLEKFEGGIGGKYWFSNKYAMYLSLDFRIANGEDDRRISDTFGSGISAGIERHFYLNKIISPYIGLGLRYQNTFDDEKEKDYEDLSSRKIHYKYERYSVSAGLLFGVEIFVVESISFSANYGLWLEYRDMDNSIYFNNGDSDQSSSKSTILHFAVSALSVNIYF